MDKLTFLKNEKLIVFGGSGFVGSSIIRRALSLGMKVTSISKNQNSGNTINDNNLKSYFFDILNGAFEDISNDSFDYAINCSGYIDHSISNNDNTVIDNHLFGLIRIIKHLKKNNLKKFINIGSSDEYGKIDFPASEYQREEPHTPYAFSKTASSHYIQMLSRNINFPGITLRPFLLYGPHQSEERLIPFAIDACLKNKNFDITEGSQLRDFLYIDDFVDAVFHSLISSTKTDGQVFNISSGLSISIREIVEMIQLKCDGGSPNFGGKSLHKKESSILLGNNDLAKKFLGWSPKTKISVGLDLTIDFFSNG